MKARGTKGWWDPGTEATHVPPRSPGPLFPWSLLICVYLCLSAAISFSFADEAVVQHPPRGASSQPLGDAGVWHILDVVETRSEAGTTLKKLDDGSLLASGPTPDGDTYTLKVKTSLRNITAFRLDALADESLPRKGPGRSTTGNFTLSRFAVAANEIAKPFTFAKADADYQQRGYEAIGALDDDKQTGWSIGNGGADHYLILFCEKPVGDSAEKELTITLEFRHPERKRYTLGRFRVSATTKEPPPPADQVPEFQPPLVKVGFAPVAIATFQSAGGAAMTQHPSGDGSILITGDKPADDTYTLELHTELDPITGLRIEALPDDSLPKKGPGRLPSGSFAVSEVTLEVAPKDKPGEKQRVKLKDASSDFASKTPSVSKAIDGNEKSHWTPGAVAGTPVAAAFTLEKSAGYSGGSVLTLTIKQRSAIGRLRVSLSQAQESHRLTLTPPKPATAKPAEEKKKPAVEFYYNVGGEGFTDPRGNRWLKPRKWADGGHGYVGGSTVTSETSNDPILREGLSGIDAFRTAIPSGRYSVTLIFAEVRAGTAPGYRKFGVAIEGVGVLRDFDPVRQTGGVDRSYIHTEKSVPVKDGRLDLEFTGEKPILNGLIIRSAGEKE